VYRLCSPSRCALQSGRNPIHVNVLNSPIVQHNPADPVGGYQVRDRGMAGEAQWQGHGGITRPRAFSPPPNLSSPPSPPPPPHAAQGMPTNMTGIAEKLTAAGYAAHQVGKWNVGMATHRHTPVGRGYNSSLGYFNYDT
jgi:arylsulfatase A-like enzyme